MESASKGLLCLEIYAYLVKYKYPEAMKKISKTLLIFAFIVCGNLSAQNRTIEDSQMKFKISVPSSYQTNQYWEGTDKIHAFVSRDNNVAVSIRSFELPANISVDQLVAAFTQNVLKGANQLVIQPHNLNGASGKMAGYRWRYNNISVVVGAFYTIRNNIGYVVWSMIPENLFANRSAESDAITNSFTLLVQSADAGSGEVKQLVPGRGISSDAFVSLVSDDAMVEHLIPKRSAVRKTEPGQTIWDIPNPSSGNNLTMVIQNIVKGGKNFNSFINEQIASIRGNGATILGRSFEKAGDFYACRYSYEYNGSRFSYTAIDGPVTFYLAGFVGGVNYAAELESIHNIVHSSFKKVTNSNSSIGQQNPQGGSIAPSTAPLQQPVLDAISSETIFDIKPNTLKLGTDVNSNNEIISVTNNFPINTKKIHLAFNYQGDTKEKNFIVKWVSKTHNTLVAEDLYYPKTGGTNKVYSFIENGDQQWPPGDYRAEVWYLGDKVSEADFSIGAAQSQLKQTNRAGEIKQIVLDNTNIGYDFASGKIRTDASPDPDVLNRPWCTSLPGICGNWARTGKSRMEDVTSPPASGYISDGLDYIDCTEAPLKEVLVFKLKDGTFGKMMIIKDEFSKINNVCLHKITCFVQYPAF
jgi:hypothetical protein